MKNIAHVAMLQMRVAESDWETNLAHADELLAQACQQPVDFAVLPECFDIGWGNPQAAALAAPVPGRISEALCTLAKKYRIYLVSGLTEKDGGNVYNLSLIHI